MTMTRVFAARERAAGPNSSSLGVLTNEVALLNKARRAEATVWLAFVAQTAFTPRLSKVLRASYRELLAAIATELGGDAEEASALLALTDGLTLHVLVGQLTPALAKKTLDAHLSRLADERR